MKELKKKLNKDSFKFLKELVENWKYNWKNIEENVNIENWEIVWKWNLYIIETKIKKVKIKKIEWDVYVIWAESLEDIEVEEIWWYLNIDWTKVKRIKVKRIGWNLDAYWAGSLEEIEIEEVKWYLDVRKTKIKKIKAKRIGWNLDAEWEEYLEDIEVEEGIWWNLYINRTNIDFQRKTLEKTKEWELKVKWRVIFWSNIKRIERLCEDKNLVIWWNLNVVWTKVKRIKLKKIEWNLYAIWEKNLEDIEVEEIGWNLYIKGTKMSLKIKILKNIEKWKLKVKWKIIFWWGFIL